MMTKDMPKEIAVEDGTYKRLNYKECIRNSILYIRKDPDTIVLSRAELEGRARNMRNPVAQGSKKNDWYQNGFDVGYNKAINDILEKE